MSQIEGRSWATVRIAGELMEPLEELVKSVKDDYGIPLFRSKSEAVTKAVKDLLDRYLPKEEEA